VFHIIIKPCLDKIYDLLLTLEDYEIREACFTFFYNLAEGLGKDFEFIFDKLIDFTLKQAASEEGIKYIKDKPTEEGFSLDTDSEDEDEFH
jgi:hypothetical protein